MIAGISGLALYQLSNGPDEMTTYKENSATRLGSFWKIMAVMIFS